MRKIPRIDQVAWEAAMQAFATIFQTSSRRELVLAIARRFDAIHPKHKYYSDWDTFVRESHIEDFTDTEEPAIYVSTIHKTKGKQFDNVFLLLNGFKPSTDEDKRLFYVAITRPKTHLAIHYNGNYLLPLASETVDHSNDEQHYPEPAQLAFMLTHQDVYLGYFSSVQDQIDGLQSGDRLLIREYGLANSSGQLVVKFSKKFVEVLTTRQQQGYRPFEAHVSFIIYWVDRATDKEWKIVLPEVVLVKATPP